MKGGATILALAAAFAASSILPSAQGHGFMVKPKSRNVISRQANQQYCPHCFNAGGTGNVAANTPGNGLWPYPETSSTSQRAGLCGDPAGNDLHMVGGELYNGGDIVATYKTGAVIDIEVGITAHHNGHFEFFLCDKSDLADPSGPITQECLNMHKLERAFPVPSSTGSPFDAQHPGRYFLEPKCSLPKTNYGFITAETSTMQYRLPKGVECDHCVLQWYWVTANSCLAPGYRTVDWPDSHSDCGGDGGSKGWWAPHLPDCGKAYPEEFWNCADIRISSKNVDQPTTPPTAIATTIPPTSATTTIPPTSATTTIPPTSPPTSTSPGMCVQAWGKCGGEGYQGPTCCEKGYFCSKSSQWYSQCVTGTNPPTAQTPTNPPTTQSTSDCAAEWKQCGGSGFSGPTCCESGLVCSKESEWYSQCVPGTQTNPPTDPATNPPTNPATNPPTNPATNPPTNPATNPPTNPATNQPTESNSCAAEWEQCGGKGFAGPTCCKSGLVCDRQSKWYSQCIVTQKTKPPTTTSPPTMAATNPPTTSTTNPPTTAAGNPCANCGQGFECIANPNSPQGVSDSQCAACAQGQSFWPCNLPTVCYCHEKGTPKIPPVMPSGLPESSAAPCDVFTKTMYDAVTDGQSREPYTYKGFCKAVEKYNALHDEKVFKMGTVENQKAEIAAFLGHTMHESDAFRAPREYVSCADKKIVDGKVYCKPCSAANFDWSTMKCRQSLVANGASMPLGTHGLYCQPQNTPSTSPPGCACSGKVREVEASGPLAGYIEATSSFFGRGAIQLSWNYNYIKASLALTGNPNTFCENPDLVATDEAYSWGAGIYYWMENLKAGQRPGSAHASCHVGVLAKQGGDWGDALFNINGGLECPAAPGSYFSKAIVKRINFYCKAASVVGVERLLSFDGCSGLTEAFRSCTASTCPDCMPWKETTSLDLISVLPGTDAQIPTTDQDAEDANVDDQGKVSPGVYVGGCAFAIVAVAGALVYAAKRKGSTALSAQETTGKDVSDSPV